jgi:hypothetical protein
MADEGYLQHCLMRLSLKKFGIFFLICSLLAGGWVQPVSALQASRLVVSRPDASLFPQISFTLEAYDPSGNFDTDLSASELFILEDDLPVQLDNFGLIQPGLELVLAINAGPSMAVRYNGATRFERLVAHLLNWVEQMPASGSDELSLATLTGLQIIRQSDPADLLLALQNYSPDLNRAQPNLAALSQALDLASNPRNTKMKRAVFYITASMPAASLGALEDLAARTASQGVRIFVWYVPLSNIPVPAEEKILLQLASQTGGHYFVYTGKEDLPGPEDYFQSMRYLYQASYTSQLNTSGNHTLFVSMDPEIENPNSGQSFSIRVQAPNPIFLNPPAQVVQTLQSGTQASASLALPQKLDLQIIVEFPDGHPRSLQATRLLVDGEVVDENLAEPFNEFEWRLAEIKASGTFLLQAEVVDSLGLSRRSIETPVEVLVPVNPSANLLEQIPLERLVIGGAILVLSISLILAILLLSRRKRRKKRSASIPAPTRPISPEALASNLSPSWPRQHSGVPAPARLMRISEAGHTIAGSAIALGRPEITFGSDPRQSIVVIDHPSLDALHARLIQSGPGLFRLYDCNSLAGTWVNWERIDDSGVQLSHQDIIQLGGITYRFELNRPEHAHTIQVSKVENLL